MSKKETCSKSKNTAVVILSMLVGMLLVIFALLAYVYFSTNGIEDDYLVRLSNGDVASVELCDSDDYYKDDEVVIAVGEAKNSYRYIRGVITKKRG